jgi:very-short-patch-repair endonuclease
MSAPTGQQPPTPVAAWPTTTFPKMQMDLVFNGQAIQLVRLPAAHTDGDTVVFFRRSDVVATGDIFDPTRYPVIDLARGGSIDGLKFRRQHPIPPYTVDFCCVSTRLVVEVDGSQHTETSDRARTQFLELKGFTVLRFWDNDVLMQIEAVVEAICRTVSPSPLTPTPLPSGEGL